ncbi:hypothetical protein CASFOL_001306 [Castilleja foliolosa]|uniref:PHD finger protein ALFIN-LIKE n=1 Tax=Castilleja foliolosa TaxID=1961234 RepID=A0ABD3EMR1_9LAMI
MISLRPTVYEVVTGAAKKQQKEKSSVSNHSSSKSKSNSKLQRTSEIQAKISKPPPQLKDVDEGFDDEEDNEGVEEEDDEHGETLCGACGDNKASNNIFWICFDICEKWFHGKCVKITPARDEHIKQYKCPSCSNNKRARADEEQNKLKLSSFLVYLLECYV